MSGLVLKLSPKERVLINGAVIENGDRRSRLSIMTPDAKILRLRDAIHPEDAKTPVRRLCYAMQLVLSGDTAANDVHHNLLRQIEDLSQVFQDQDSRGMLSPERRSCCSSCFSRHGRVAGRRGPPLEPRRVAGAANYGLHYGQFVCPPHGYPLRRSHGCSLLHGRARGPARCVPSKILLIS